MTKEAVKMGQPAAPDPGVGPLSLLLVPLAGGWFGLDLEQLRAIESPPAGDEMTADAPVAFHRLLGLAAGEYRHPRVVRLKNGAADGAEARLLIEAPADIVEADWRKICPLPPLAEPFTRPLGVWGVLPRAGRLLLLLDFQPLQPRLSELSCKEKG